MADWIPGALAVAKYGIAVGAWIIAGLWVGQAGAAAIGFETLSLFGFDISISTVISGVIMSVVAGVFAKVFL